MVEMGFYKPACHMNNQSLNTLLFKSLWSVVFFLMFLEEVSYAHQGVYLSQ